MNSLDLLKIAALGLAGVFAWGLVCIAIWGAPKTSKRQAEELAEQAEALKIAQIAKEGEWMAELEHAIPILQSELIRLHSVERTLDSIREKTRIHMALFDAERSLMTLKQRRAFGTYNQKGRA